MAWNSLFGGVLHPLDVVSSQKMDYGLDKARVISMAWQSSVVATSVFLLAPAAAHSKHCPPEALGVARTIEVGTKGGIQVGLKPIRAAWCSTIMKSCSLSTMGLPRKPRQGFSTR